MRQPVSSHNGIAIMKPFCTLYFTIIVTLTQFLLWECDHGSQFWGVFLLYIFQFLLLLAIRTHNNDIFLWFSSLNASVSIYFRFRRGMFNLFLKDKYPSKKAKHSILTSMWCILHVILFIKQFITRQFLVYFFFLLLCQPSI